MGEYPRYIPTYTTYTWVIQWLYRAIWCNVLGTTARVPKGTQNFPLNIQEIVPCEISWNLKLSICWLFPWWSLVMSHLKRLTSAGSIIRKWLGAFQIMWNFKKSPGIHQWIGTSCAWKLFVKGHGIFQKSQANLRRYKLICKYVTVGPSNAFYIQFDWFLHFETRSIYLCVIASTKKMCIYIHDIMITCIFTLLTVSLKEALSGSIPGGKDMAIAFDQVRTGQMCFRMWLVIFFCLKISWESHIYTIIRDT